MQKRKSKYTVGGYKLRVGKSKTGKGIFTEEAIPKGKCIIEYVGVSVSDKEMETINSKYLFEISKKLTINGNVSWNKAKYINHSCRPNCEAEGPNGHVYIMARKNIKSGEELTYDYGKEYWDEYIKPVGCRCEKCTTPKK
ncbi:MAG: SET domain-containing protein [Minisyncoccia bacterium]